MKKLQLKIILLFAIALSSCMKNKKVDLVVHNAKVYTMDGEFKIAQAMAIKDGKIVAIDKEREIMNQYRADEFFDAKTLPIYPGFIDAHCHFLWSGLNYLSADLKNAKSKKDVIKIIKEYQTKQSDLKWIVGFGWDETQWEDKTLNNEFLNKEFPDIPVLLWRIDGHSLLVNDYAIKEVSPISEIINGIVTEEDISIFVDKIDYTEVQKNKALLLAQKDCFKYGITTVSDAGLTFNEINLIKKLQEKYELEMRVYGMAFFTNSNIEFYAKNGKDSTDKLSVHSIKVMLDGSVGSESACMKTAYEGTTNYGKLLMTEQELETIAKYCYENDFQLNVHCIGDSAVKVALDVMGKFLKGHNDRRWRIEHAQIIDKKDIEKFFNYSIHASIQPTHGIDDLPMAKNKLGNQRIKNSYLINTLIEANGMVAFGTDFPVADKDPLLTFYNAVVRKDKDSKSEKYLLKETVTRKQALYALTFWNAMINQQENNRGSLEVGKYADFVILNRDILKVSEQELLKANVKYTFLDGNIVYQE